MQKTKGFCSTVGAVTALVCFCLGICYGSHRLEPKHRYLNNVTYSHNNAKQSSSSTSLKAVESPVEHITDLAD